MSSVERINFIEKEPFTLTYRKMVILGCLIFGLFLFLFGVQWIRQEFASRRLDRITAEVEQQKAERERVLRELSAVAGDERALARATLADLLNRSITWSAVLKELTTQAPNSLWLTTVKSYEKADLPSKRGLLLSGFAEEATLVAQFVRSLTESAHFDHVVLTSVKQETGEKGPSYSFSIELAVGAPKPGGST